MSGHCKCDGRGVVCQDLGDGSRLLTTCPGVEPVECWKCGAGVPPKSAEDACAMTRG